MPQASPQLAPAWPELTLAELCTPRRELVTPSPGGARRYIGLEHLSPGVHRIRRWGTEEALRSAKSMFRIGDILYGKLRPYLDKAALAEWDGVCSTDILTLKPNPDYADPLFLSFLLHTPPFLSHAIATTSGVNHPRTSWADIATFAHPIPPLSEQRGIARMLAVAQAATELQDKTLAALEELKAATMAKLFREGMLGKVHKRTEIGEIPESWEMRRLGDIATIERGKFAHRPRNDPRFYGGSTPFIQTGDVTQSNGRIRSFKQTLNERGLEISRVFPKGTIVLTIAANIGDTGILEFDSAFPDSMVGITPDPTVDTEFLEYYLRTQRQGMDRLAPKGTQKNINIQFLMPWPVPRPSIDEQRDIAAHLRRLDSRLEAATTRRAALHSLFASMLRLLMTGQIRIPLSG